MKELLKTFEKDPTLGYEVEMMWAYGASAQEVMDKLFGSEPDTRELRASGSCCILGSTNSARPTKC